tara:strand:+ start:601 stop:840 length:240 start_codon:yes stop_codon:yes gene_type:complete
MTHNYPNYAMDMEEFACRLDVTVQSVYKLIDAYDDSKSILKGTYKHGALRKIDSWRVDEIIEEIKKMGGIDSYANTTTA